MKILLIRGLPGSGKSTLAKALVESGDYDHNLEADMYFTDENGEYNFRPEAIGQAHAWCTASTKASLSSGMNVIVSNTFTQKWEAQPYLDMAEELGAEVEIKTLTENYGSIHGVPEEALARMAERWEDF